MRGTVFGRPRVMPSTRITPADAGNRLPTSLHQYQRSDHPRGCGEQSLESLNHALSSGSPPRMRGTERYTSQDGSSRGITPADAGNRNGYSRLWYRYQDHPRGCGEQAKPRHYGEACSGSPPRMRGTEKLAKASVKGSRITPADAGNRSEALFHFVGGEDHPRGCGEQRADFLPWISKGGSPPRMRGTV